MSTPAFTPGPWFVGAQNDWPYIIAGRRPSLDNDAPWHDAPRVVIAKPYGPHDGDVLPVDAVANADLMAAAPDLYAALQGLVAAPTTAMTSEQAADARRAALAALAKARGKQP